MNFKLKVWRQKDGRSPGSFKDYDAKDIPSEASFLEMLDIVNETLVTVDEDPIAFDSDCREGICGTCSLVINGVSHGPGKGTTCQVYMRRFADGDTIWIEPFRAAGFPPVKDLVVDRSAFDQIIEAGGYIVVRTGSAPEANSLPVPKHDADLAMEAAACIGCGACVAACPNAAAALFTGAKISHLGLLPQGQPERFQRALKMVAQVKEELFGSCTNIGECEAVCPKEIKLEVIARMNRDYLKASWTERPEVARGDD